MGRIQPDDVGLWHRAMRDVAPLRDRNLPPAPERDRGRLARPGADAGETPAVRSLSPVPSSPPAPPLDGFAGVDRATAERVKRGRYPVAARLDLHGLIQSEAHTALAGFVAASRVAGKRCVLVITGNGRSSGGVLKAAVPRWLAEPELRRHVLAIAPAQPPHGGGGALYVLLRRAPH
jgi:DNA-nicking Smr family endonuclease